MTVAARLLATIAAALDRASADAPQVLYWPGRRLLVQRGDTEVVALDLDVPHAGAAPETRFPAPWPRRFGPVTVPPQRDTAVFAGVHALRSVEAGGATRWQVRHACWHSGCTRSHVPFDKYAHDQEHFCADSGSVAVSAEAGWCGHTSAVRWAATRTWRTTRSCGWSWTPRTAGPLDA